MNIMIVGLEVKQVPSFKYLNASFKSDALAYVTNRQNLDCTVCVINSIRCGKVDK